MLTDNLRLVVLNACYSRPQAEAITKSIDAAVGMKRAIGDEAAIVFAVSFYRALGFGRSVKEASELGVVALSMEGGWNIALPNSWFEKESTRLGSTWLYRLFGNLGDARHSGTNRRTFDVTAYRAVRDGAPAIPWPTQAPRRSPIRARSGLHDEWH